MIKYSSMDFNDDMALLKKSEEIQFKMLDFATLQSLELIGNIVGKARLQKALHRWILLDRVEKTVGVPISVRWRNE